MNSTVSEAEVQARAFSGGDWFGVLVYKYIKYADDLALSVAIPACSTHVDRDSVVVGASADSRQQQLVDLNPPS